MVVRTSNAFTSNPATIRNKYKAGCPKCDIWTPECASEIVQDEKGKIYIKKNGAEDAINKWNRRERDEVYELDS